jgi:hypothetical protein
MNATMRTIGEISAARGPGSQVFTEGMRCCPSPRTLMEFSELHARARHAHRSVSSILRQRIVKLAAPHEVLPRAPVALGTLPRRMIWSGRLVAARVALHHGQNRSRQRGDDVLFRWVVREHNRPLPSGSLSDSTSCPPARFQAESPSPANFANSCGSREIYSNKAFAHGLTGPIASGLRARFIKPRIALGR